MEDYKHSCKVRHNFSESILSNPRPRTGSILQSYFLLFSSCRHGNGYLIWFFHCTHNNRISCPSANINCLSAYASTFCISDKISKRICRLFLIDSSLISFIQVLWFDRIKNESKRNIYCKRRSRPLLLINTLCRAGIFRRSKVFMLLTGIFVTKMHKKLFYEIKLHIIHGKILYKRNST